MTSAPLWLVHIVGRHPLTVQAATSRLAVAQAERRGYVVVYHSNGLPVVSCAGYAADCGCDRPRPMPRGMAQRKRRRDDLADTARARACLELRDEVRSGVIRTTGSERQVSDAALRSFAADVGLAIERVDDDESFTVVLDGEDAGGIYAALACALILEEAGEPWEEARKAADRTRRVTLPRLHRQTTDDEPEVSARQTANIARCEVCGRHLERGGVGRPRRYCGCECKARAAGARRRA